MDKKQVVNVVCGKINNKFAAEVVKSCSQNTENQGVSRKLWVFEEYSFPYWRWRGKIEEVWK